MADTRISEFVTLRCACGGELFNPIIRMKIKSDAGTITEPAGHHCIACNAVVDPRYMAQLVEQQRKRDTIKQLQAELGDEPVRSVAPILVAPPR